MDLYYGTDGLDLFHHVLFNMGDLHLVLPALNLSTLNAGNLIIMQQVRLMMFSLNMVEYSILPLTVHLRFFCWTSRVAHKILVSAQGPLFFSFWVLGAWV